MITDLLSMEQQRFLSLKNEWEEETGYLSSILVDVEYDSTMDENTKIFGEKMAKKSLGLMGNPADRVSSSWKRKPCIDLLVWEHRKRYARYTLRPLILIKDKYYWGPYSAMKSAIIWSDTLSFGTLPCDLQSPTIQNVIDS